MRINKTSWNLCLGIPIAGDYVRSILKSVSRLGTAGTGLFLGIFIPAVGPLIVFIGAVLILKALRMLSRIINDRAIFNNAAIAIAFLAVFVASEIIFIEIPYIQNPYIKLFGGEISLPFPARFLYVKPPEGFTVIWSSMVAASIFFARALKRLSSITGIELFSRAGAMYIAGSVFSILFFLGVPLIFLAMDLQAKGFSYLDPDRGA